MNVSTPKAGRFTVAVLAAVLLSAAGAAPARAAKPAPVAVADGKIPITTSSEAARTAYLEGRDLTERLRIQEARGAYERALADPNRPRFAAPREEPVRRRAAKIGRNDPCPCGSGRKYKSCCLRLL